MSNTNGLPAAGDKLPYRKNACLLNKQILSTMIILAMLLVFIFGQARTWRQLSWSVFWNNCRDVSLLDAFAAIVMTYIGFLTRAVRWKVFLRPMKQVSSMRLLGPTIIGFTGLALLGRVGELIRPYMIARNEDLRFSSQIAVLAVERVFDSIAVGTLIAAFLAFSPELKSLPYLAQFRRAVVVLVALTTVFACALLLLASRRQSFSNVLYRTLSPLSPRLAQRASHQFQLFGAELNLIRDARSLAQIIILSLATWFVSGLSQYATVYALSSARQITIGGGMLLLGLGVLGSLVQIPGGGSQQLVTMAALVRMFGLRPELAITCTILGWFTIFMAPVPTGLFLLRHEGLRLHKLSEKTQQSAAVAESEKQPF